MPDSTQAANGVPADVAALIAAAPWDAVPPPLESTGPADDEPTDQEPGFEEVDVLDGAADESLADPAVLEV